MESKGDEQLGQDVKRFQTPPMASHQPATLPHSFTFHHYEAPPKTPEMPRENTPEPPSPPGPAKVRIKRRSHPGLKSNPDLRGFVNSGQNILPSIELSETTNEPPVINDQPAPQDDLLAPASSSSSTVVRRFVSPPRTPLAQVFSPGDDNIDWSQFTPAPRRGQGHSIARPLSPWSELSDSSGCSSDSLDTYPSFGGSCTSPESDAADPFTFTQRKQAASPSPKQMRCKKGNKRLHLKWTDEMDEHLWRTYMKYLADPTNTPFKTLPGAPPPLGVCHRVTRVAKKTWKGNRTTLQTVAEDGPSGFASLDETLANSKSSPSSLGTPPSTLKPNLLARNSSGGGQKPSATWFKSASATRRRLRYLCKRKPSLSPHYQRLLRSRSPSPIESSSHPQSSSSIAMSDNTSFATRDLNVNLAASTASSMQPGGPLARLTMEGYEAKPSTPSRHGPHQKSQSLQSNLGFGMNSPAQQQYPGLASPFEWYRPGQQPPDEPRTVLASPIELHHPKPLSSSMKRRAQYALGEEMLSEDPETRRNALEDMFRESGGIGNGKRRVRSRGFSTGAMNNSGPPSRHISQVFDPPGYPMPHIDPEPQAPQLGMQMHIDGSTSGSAQTWHAPPPAFDPSGTLGSPFAPRATSGTFGMSNTFPRSLFPQGLDSISSLDQQRQGNDQGVHGGCYDDDDPFSGSSGVHDYDNFSSS